MTNGLAWVFLRAKGLNGEMKKLSRRPWAASVASVPGDWDYLLWAGGKDWEQVWSNVSSLSKSGWDTETVVPLKTWWNKKWQRASWL